jgi:hypothetical protein
MRATHQMPAIKDALAKDANAAVILSAILGLGLAAICRATCKGDACVVMRSPPPEDIAKRTYRLSQEACYRYVPEVSTCD